MASAMTSPAPLPAEPALVVVVEDDPLVRDMLADTFDTYALPCRTYAQAEALLDAGLPADTACVVSDIRMPGMGGLALQRQLATDHPWLPVLLISGHADISMAVQAMKDGAFDFIEKPFSPAILVERVRAAMMHGAHCRVSDAARLSLCARFDLLSEREWDVMHALGAGKVTKLIARELDLSPRTVEHHRERIAAKLDAAGLNDLMHLYARWRLLTEA